MPFSSELDKIRDSIRQIEDPAVAMALRHVCKAMEEMQVEGRPSSQERQPAEKHPQQQ